MKASWYCLPCILTQTINTARLITNDDKLLRKIINRTINYLKEVDLNLSPAILSTPPYRLIEKLTGCSDPYKEIKRKYNDIALSLLNEAKQIINTSDDRIYQAIKLSCVGNVIDLGIGYKVDIEAALNDIQTKGFRIDNYRKFKKELNKKKLLLFVGDNAGEIVFDKLLVEELVTKLDVVYVVRGGPIINDATMEEAKYIGLDNVCKVITTGNNYCGIEFSKVSKEFLYYYNKADIILSKGHANYETLTQGNKQCYFLLKVKCEIVAQDIGVNKDEVVFIKK